MVSDQLKGLSILLNSSAETLERYDEFLLILIGVKNNKINFEIVQELLEVLEQMIILNYGMISDHFAQIILKKFVFCL